MQKITVATIEEITDILVPIRTSLNEIKSKIDKVTPPKKYYRNKDLKQVFGFSDNTIISYRDNNIIPSTHIGGIWYYPVDAINKILEANSNHYQAPGNSN